MTPHNSRLRVEAPTLTPPPHLADQLAGLARASVPTHRRRRFVMFGVGAVVAMAASAGGAWASGSITVPGLPGPGATPSITAPRSTPPPTHEPSATPEPRLAPGVEAPRGTTPRALETVQPQATHGAGQDPSARTARSERSTPTPGSKAAAERPESPRGKATGHAKEPSKNRPDSPGKNRPRRADRGTGAGPAPRTPASSRVSSARTDRAASKPPASSKQVRSPQGRSQQDAGRSQGASHGR